MSKLKENIIIHNEDNIDLESNYDDIDNASEVSQETNMLPSINGDLYIVTQTKKSQDKKLEDCNNVQELLEDVEYKVENLNDIQMLLEFKLLHYKQHFRILNFRLLIFTVLLTFIEVLYKQFNIVNSSELVSGVTKNIVLLIPILITCQITLLSAWIKNLKFEEIIENISRAVEKLITAKIKLQKILQDVSIKIKKNNNNFSKEEFDKLKGKYKNGLNEYLEAYSIADKNYNAKDLSKYLSEYLKTKKNEKKLELGRIKIRHEHDVDMEKIRKKTEISMNKIEKDCYIKDKLKKYEFEKDKYLLNTKIKNIKNIYDVMNPNDGMIPNDNDISHIKENKIYTKIKKIIKYLFNR